MLNFLICTPLTTGLLTATTRMTKFSAFVPVEPSSAQRAHMQRVERALDHRAGDFEDLAFVLIKVRFLLSHVMVRAVDGYTPHLFCQQRRIAEDLLRYCVAATTLKRKR